MAIEVFAREFSSVVRFVSFPHGGVIIMPLRFAVEVAHTEHRLFDCPSNLRIYAALAAFELGYLGVICIASSKLFAGIPLSCRIK